MYRHENKCKERKRRNSKGKCKVITVEKSRKDARKYEKRCD